MKKLPVIEASGNNYDIGFTIGQKLRKQMKKLIGMERVDYRKMSGKPLSYYSEKIRRIVGVTEKYFPGYIEELLGIAEGSRFDFNTLFAIGCEDDLIFNCTSVAGFSKEGIILGHNEDWFRDHLKSLYICRIEQKGKPDSISLSYVGHLPGFSVGFNSAGCARTENSISAKVIYKRKLPLQFLMRACLDVRKYSELVRIVSIRDKMIGGNSLIAFNNKIFDIEFLPKGYAMIKGKNYLSHTNHIVSSRLRFKEMCHSRDSVWRLNRANELLEKNEFNFNLVKRILSDHKHRPFSICCHEFEQKGKERYCTMASVIVKIDRKEFFVAHGNPCEAEYVKYCL